MAKTLDVYLFSDLTGHLTQDEVGRMRFKYADSWLKNPLSMPLSRSLPLRDQRYSNRECRGYFAGVLPEADKRKLIARNLGISDQNDYSMLEQIGGDCAGAVTFLPSGATLPDRDDRFREINSDELANLLAELPQRPLLAGTDGLRLSLAGAQDKLAVHVDGEKILLMLGTSPSTHILKPAVQSYEGIVSNEAACMLLAARIGLDVAKTEVRQVHGVQYLLVERYDRSRNARTGRVGRLHQEDLCQALGVVPEKKYQSEGGPSLEHCFALLREVSTTPIEDLKALLDAVIFNAIIGNNDAHAKNFSLLYERGDFSRVRLAPLYDLISTVMYPQLSKRMAMKIGSESVSDNLVPAHVEKFAKGAGLSPAIVVRRVKEVAHLVTKAAIPYLNHPEVGVVMSAIKVRAETFVSRF